jgi:hypothetical protein
VRVSVVTGLVEPAGGSMMEYNATLVLERADGCESKMFSAKLKTVFTITGFGVPIVIEGS